MSDMGAIARGSQKNCTIDLLPVLPAIIKNIGFKKYSRRLIPAWSGYGILNASGTVNDDGLLQGMFTDPLNGYIAGHIYTDSSKTNPVVGQPVYLMCRNTRQFVALTFTDSTGRYEFDQLVSSLKYIVFTGGYSTAVNGLIADDITPGTH